jgi:hydrogenase maturation protease
VKTLVAGIGNIFLGDDAFGVEVLRHLPLDRLPDDVRVMDFGIRGIHLAHELLSGYDAVVLVDCLPNGEAPGTVSVLEVEAEVPAEEEEDTDELEDQLLADAHSFQPHVALEMVSRLGGKLGSRVYVVGCEPESTAEGMNLSGPVAEAVPRGVEAVIELVRELHAGKQAAGERGVER